MRDENRTRIHRIVVQMCIFCNFSLNFWVDSRIQYMCFHNKKAFFCECVCDFPIFSPMDRERKVCASVCEFALSKLNSQAMFLFAAACCCIRMKDRYFVVVFCSQTVHQHGSHGSVSGCVCATPSTRIAVAKLKL